MQLINQLKKQLYTGSPDDETVTTDWVDATGLSTLSFGISGTFGGGATDASYQIQCSNNVSLGNSDVGTATAITETGYNSLEILQPGMNFYRVEIATVGGPVDVVIDVLGKGNA